MRLCYVREPPCGEDLEGARWARAFGGDVRTLAELESVSWSCRREGVAWPYDVVLFDVTPEGRAMPPALREVLAPHPPCALALHVGRSPGSDERERAIWRDALAAGDVVLTSQRSVSRTIRRELGLLAYDVSPPLPEPLERSERSERNTTPFRTLERSERSERNTTNHLTVVVDGGYGHRDLIAEIGLLSYLWARLRHGIVVVSPCVDRERLARAVRRSAIVYLPRPIEDGGVLAALCAASGAVLVAHRGYDPAKRSFPFTTFAEAGGRRRRRLLFAWLYTSRVFVEFFRAHARRAALDERTANARVEFVRKLEYARPGRSADENPTRRTLERSAGISGAWIDRIHHRHGPVDVDCQPDECLLVCLVRNGEVHLPSFLGHYRAIGVKHFIFVDNGSDDRTAGILSRQADVTLYETALPHKEYESHIRRLVLERHCRRRWSLNVDIDELFDYPMSDRLAFRELLRYHTLRGATAMAGYMLDMYAKETAFAEGEAPDLRRDYPFYDVTGVTQMRYHTEEFAAYCDENVLLDPRVPCQAGGIREQLFGSDRTSRYLLIKHPLVFLDGVLEPATHPHYCNGATIADVTCVLYHYKFTASFKAQVEESCRSGRYVSFAQRQYQRYARKTRAANLLRIDTPGTRRLGDVQELVDQGFLIASPTYVDFVQREGAPAIAGPMAPRQGLS